MASEKPTDKIDYKRNPDLFVSKLQQLPGNFLSLSQNTTFNLLIEDNLKTITADLQISIDKFIEDEFQVIKKKVEYLADLEEMSATKPQIDEVVVSRPQFINSVVLGLKEKQLQQRREYLKQRLQEAIIESTEAENELKIEMRKHEDK